MRPTGNCRPALADLLTAFLPEVLPLPRPDMVGAEWLQVVQEAVGMAGRDLQAVFVGGRPGWEGGAQHPPGSQGWPRPDGCSPIMHPSFRASFNPWMAVIVRGRCGSALQVDREGAGALQLGVEAVHQPWPESPQFKMGVPCCTILGRLDGREAVLAQCNDGQGAVWDHGCRPCRRRRRRLPRCIRAHVWALCSCGSA